MLQSYIGNDISEEQMIKVIGSISLETTHRGKVIHISDYDKEVF